MDLVSTRSRETYSDVTRVKAQLTNGTAEILDQHQDLLGKICNNVIEIETNLENKLEKIYFVAQEAIFGVSTKRLDKKVDFNKTSVYVYATEMLEINSNTPLEDLKVQFDSKSSELEIETQKLKGESSDFARNAINAKLVGLKNDVEFLGAALKLAKDLKK